MHLVIGFLLASILRKKASLRSGMPSIIGKLETIHALPGRVRFNSPLLEDLQVKTKGMIDPALFAGHPNTLMLSILALALYRILIQGDRTLPGGINLLWWTYVMARRGR